MSTLEDILAPCALVDGGLHPADHVPDVVDHDIDLNLLLVLRLPEYGAQPGPAASTMHLVSWGLLRITWYTPRLVIEVTRKEEQMVKEGGKLVPFRSLVDEEREEESATDSKLNTFRKELGKKSSNNKSMDPIEDLMV